MLTACWGQHSHLDEGWRTVLEWYKPANTRRRAYYFRVTSSKQAHKNTLVMWLRLNQTYAVSKQFGASQTTQQKTKCEKNWHFYNTNVPMQVVFIVWLEIHALRDSLSHFPALHQSDPVELNQLGAPDGGKGTGGAGAVGLEFIGCELQGHRGQNWGKLCIVK